jgi:hypothetical protein
MFKRLVVSAVLGVALLTSFALWAKPSDAPTMVAKIEVHNQLSFSAHEAGESKFISQIGDAKQSETKLGESKMAMSVVSVFWTMAFALLFFVIRVTARRIK